jgi:hypothetical protein
MFLAVHAAVGAIAGNAVQDPTAAFALGVVSHFFTDMIPHGDEGMYEGYKNGTAAKRAYLYVGADAIATVLLITFFFVREDFFNPLAVAMGIVGGLLPDLLVGLFEVLRPKRRTLFNRALAKFHGFHMANHHFLIKHARGGKDIPLRYGMAMQLVVLVSLVRVIV